MDTLQPLLARLAAANPDHADVINAVNTEDLQAVITDQLALEDRDSTTVITAILRHAGGERVDRAVHEAVFTSALLDRCHAVLESVFPRQVTDTLSSADLAASALEIIVARHLASVNPPASVNVSLAVYGEIVARYVLLAARFSADPSQEGNLHVAASTQDSQATDPDTSAVAADATNQPPMNQPASSDADLVASITESVLAALLAGPLATRLDQTSPDRTSPASPASSIMHLSDEPDLGDINEDLTFGLPQPTTAQRRQGTFTFKASTKDIRQFSGDPAKDGVTADMWARETRAWFDTNGVPVADWNRIILGRLDGRARSAYASHDGASLLGEELFDWLVSTYGSAAGDEDVVLMANQDDEEPVGELKSRVLTLHRRGIVSESNLSIYFFDRLRPILRETITNQNLAGPSSPFDRLIEVATLVERNLRRPGYSRIELNTTVSATSTAPATSGHNAGSNSTSVDPSDGPVRTVRAYKARLRERRCFACNSNGHHLDRCPHANADLRQQIRALGREAADDRGDTNLDGRCANCGAETNRRRSSHDRGEQSSRSNNNEPLSSRLPNMVRDQPRAEVMALVTDEVAALNSWADEIFYNSCVCLDTMPDEVSALTNPVASVAAIAGASGLRSVPVSVGGTEIDALLDSGASDAIVTPKLLFAHGHHLAEVQGLTVTSGKTDGAETSGQLNYITSGLLPVTINDAQFVIKAHACSDSTYALILPGAFLQSQHAVVDYGSGRLSLETPSGPTIQVTLSHQPPTRATALTLAVSDQPATAQPVTDPPPPATAAPADNEPEPDETSPDREGDSRHSDAPTVNCEWTQDFG